MFQIALSMLKMAEDDINKATNSADIFNVLSMIPNKVDDVDQLLCTAFDHFGGDVTADTIEELRRKHLSFIMSDISRYCLNVDTGGSNAPIRPWHGRR